MIEGFGVEVWRGGVNTWQCDWMGHMNVRFYVAAAEEALAAFAAELGMPGAFAADAGATLMVRDHHIRFLREARASDLITMTAGVLEIGESDAKLQFVLWHERGEPCASLVVTVAHVTARDERPFPWPSAARERAQRLTVKAQDYVGPRSVTGAPPSGQANLARADELGLHTVGSGVIMQADADAFGRMNSQVFIGRVSDGVSRVIGDFRKHTAAHAAVRPARVGGAVLENRLVYLRWPRIGDRFVIRSGVSEVNERTAALTHWLLDPHTGEAWGVASARAIVLDLDTRKVVPVTPAALEALKPGLFPNLTL